MGWGGTGRPLAYILILYIVIYIYIYYIYTIYTLYIYWTYIYIYTLYYILYILYIYYKPPIPQGGRGKHPFSWTSQPIPFGGGQAGLYHISTCFFKSKRLVFVHANRPQTRNMLKLRAANRRARMCLLNFNWNDHLSCLFGSQTESNPDRLAGFVGGLYNELTIATGSHVFPQGFWIYPLF